jgi:hypothetical protein
MAEELTEEEIKAQEQLAEAQGLLDGEKAKGILKLLLGDAVDQLDEEKLQEVTEQITDKIGQLVGVAAHFATAGLAPFPKELLPNEEESDS